MLANELEMGMVIILNELCKSKLMKPMKHLLRSTAQVAQADNT